MLITLPQHPEANQALGEAATELGVRGVNAGLYMPAMDAVADGSYEVELLGERIEVASPLRGVHQQRNVALAIAAAVELKCAHGFPITPAGVSQGIQQTRWPGRLERMEKNGVEWILDVAHNPAGAWALRAGLRGLEAKRPQTLIFSCLRDKPVAEMAQILFPLFDQVILAPIQSSRAAKLEDLEATARATGSVAVSANSVRQALEWAGERSVGGVVVISGSVYLVGEARSLLLSGELGGVER
jgi:dihydrofolate synthase/folylpolyglutamate synthase